MYLLTSIIGFLEYNITDNITDFQYEKKENLQISYVGRFVPATKKKSEFCNIV